MSAMIPTPNDEPPSRGLRAGLLVSGLLALSAQALGSRPGPSAAGDLQAPAAQTAPTADFEELQGRELRRILHLRGGHTLRAISRRSETGWEYKAGREWQLLPAGAVERAALEKDVLGEMRARRRVVDDDSPSKRAELAHWMLGAGLLEEGLAEADRVLSFERDHPRMLAVLREHAFRFALPIGDSRAAQGAGSGAEPEVDWDELLRYGARSVASLRELAIVRIEAILEQAEEPEAAREMLERRLFDSSLSMRGFAALALRRLFPGEAVRPLLSRAVMDSSEEVRLEAALALKAANEPALVTPVVRALERSASSKVRRHSAEALGNMGYAIAVAPLVSRLAALQGASGHSVPHSNIFIGRQFAFIQDFDVEVAQFQAVADPQINVLIEGEVLDAGVRGVQETHFVAERRAIQGALGNLTGEDPGRSSRDWLRWWEENASRWLPAETAASDD